MALLNPNYFCRHKTFCLVNPEFCINLRNSWGHFYNQRLMGSNLCCNFSGLAIAYNTFYRWLPFKTDNCIYIIDYFVLSDIRIPAQSQANDFIAVPPPYSYKTRVLKYIYIYSFEFTICIISWVKSVKLSGICKHTDKISVKAFLINVLRKRSFCSDKTISRKNKIFHVNENLCLALLYEIVVVWFIHYTVLANSPKEYG